MNVLYRFNRLLKRYSWTETESKLFTVFANNSIKSENQNGELVLIQCVEDYYYYGLFGQIITDLHKIKEIQVEQYILRNFGVNSHSSIQNYLKNKLLVNRFMDKKWTRLYGTFCNRVAYSNEQSLGLFKDFTFFLKAKKIVKNISSKEELIALKYENILIGDLVYDTYLRFKPAPTVCLDDFYLVIVIWKALRNIQIAKNYFSENRPKLLLQSYSAYIQHGITARIALQNDIDVYTFGNYQSLAKKISLDDHFHVASSIQYKYNFELFSDKEGKYLQAEQALQNRLAGKIDIATSYMKESAYKISETKLPDVDEAVIVFLHDFYDSPHIYRNMVFADFLEWIEFTIYRLEKYSIKYFLKPHPNQQSESRLVVEDLCKKYPHVKVLSPKITNIQLVNSGIKLGITVYGTVAHELVFMGIPVITCGDNPHSSYSFCFEAKDRKQYGEFLKEIDKLDISEKKNVNDEIKSFYYMHNLNKSNIEIELLKELSSFRKICSSLNLEGENDEYQDILCKLKNNTEYRRFVENLKW